MTVTATLNLYRVEFHTITFDNNGVEINGKRTSRQTRMVMARNEDTAGKAIPAPKQLKPGENIKNSVLTVRKIYENVLVVI